MDCNEEKVVLFWSGELEEEERRCVAAHLERCEACRDVLSSLERAESVLEMLPEPEPPRGIVEAAFARERRRHLNSALSIAATVLVLIGAGAWFLLSVASKKQDGGGRDGETGVAQVRTEGQEAAEKSSAPISKPPLRERIWSLRERVRRTRRRIGISQSGDDVLQEGRILLTDERKRS